jgi:hypothetical protein
MSGVSKKNNRSQVPKLGEGEMDHNHLYFIGIAAVVGIWPTEIMA